jgi:hypothetical protein
MADLTDIQAAQTVKIVGAGLSGSETTPMAVDVNGSAQHILYDSSGNPISAASPGTSGNRRLHVATPDITVASAALGALNASISIPMTGMLSAGFQIAAGTLIGTLIPESSIDGGTTWWPCAFIDSSTNTVSYAYTFTASNPLTILSIIPINGASNVRVRVSAYTSGTANGLLRASMSRGANQSVATTQVVSSLPAAQITSDILINPGVTAYKTYTASQKIAIKQFYAAGTGIGQQALYYYFPSITQYVNAGDFENPADINTTWTWVSGGTGSIASATSPVFTGSRSVALTFSNSSGGNAQGVKQTFSSPVDVSGWRYVTAQFFNTLSAGGAYTRTISIILTDQAGSTKKFDVAGTSTTAPFNASNWIKITGEIENPTSTTGTGFDDTQVVSLELRMADTANKSGTVNWDTVQFEAQRTLILPIFHDANVSLNVNIDPVAVLNAGSQLLISQTNADATRKEFFALVGGVAL